MIKRAATAMGGLALLATALATGPPAQASTTGQATPARTTAKAVVCGINVGAVTAAGDHVTETYAATRPPTQTAYQMGPRAFYPPGQARLSSTFLTFGDALETQVVGYLTLGDSMYSSSYFKTPAGEVDTSLPVTLKRIGGGWSTYTAFEVSHYANWSSHRTTAYGLRNDGMLSRWSVDDSGVWRNRVTYSGLKGVKSIALISKTATYDTFLANTAAGVLQTIRIPTTAPLKPVVKTVRGRSWQGFETLVATKCGTSGTLLLGIDKDHQTGYLYAVGHASGTSTLIQSIGLVQSFRFHSPVYFRWGAPPLDDPLNGE
ncbi:hypothetical protein [Kribbella shirazensis]|uniref:Uncharacterized protein n=1 Tax=Kribbella shirazensis TaxID=1105143 RepID=A0A7X5V492_9ACTN|nr:hypothetical protein [Kribbella shirazensis]NIK54340.1 hypothetical protein [Kribbella shirazensis]